MAWTGSEEMSRFQMLSGGKIGQFESDPPPVLGALTVKLELAIWLSQVAATCAVPAATPVTMPLELTVAAAVLSLAQVMRRPVSVLPLPSLGVAVSCWVAPTLMLAVVGETDTEATGTTTTLIV